MERKTELPVIARDELLLIRHAPARHGGRLCGRTDVPAQLPAVAGLAQARALLAGCAVVTSPARRCRETAAALFPGAPLPEDARLWEQDFGVEDGLPFADLPDLGALRLSALAGRAAPGGESFAAMAARVIPALEELQARVRAEARPIAAVVHAGTIRAALGQVLGQESGQEPGKEPGHVVGDVWRGLAFEVAPLSVTRLRCHPQGVSIIATNAELTGG